MSWIRITDMANIPLREGRAVQLGQREIAIFHLPEKFVAIDNVCPHNGGPLCDGIVKGTTVVCPLHGWNICLESGRVVKPDLPIGIHTYPVRVVNDIIEVELKPLRAESADAAAA
jgi:nitrite reductase (NADH) small subunit